MDHLRSIATTYYLSSSTEDQKKVDDFIKALDKDGDGEVDFSEFMQCLKEQGYKDYADIDFFKKLDKNGDRHLDFSEVMTLYYIIVSGRPFCTGCDDFITAEYFVCVECFEMQASAPIYLCPSCYRDGNHKHSHNNKYALFLDTYAMLEYQRLFAHTKKESHKVEESPSAPSSSSLAIASSRISSKSLTVAAFKTFETALGLANLKVGLLGLGISACTIM